MSGTGYEWEAAEMTLEEKNAALKNAVLTRIFGENSEKSTENGSKSAENGIKTCQKCPKIGENEAKTAENEAKTAENGEIEPKSAKNGQKPGFCDEFHPVLADPYDESGDEPDPLHERALHPSSVAFMETLEEIRSMHLSKSQDYGSATDPLANIRNGADFVGIEPWRAAMVRLSDKVTRLATFNRTGSLNHEAVEDSLLDLASYALLCLVLRREQHSQHDG